jgi:hypothetical protein
MCLAGFSSPGFIDFSHSRFFDYCLYYILRLDALAIARLLAIFRWLARFLSFRYMPGLNNGLGHVERASYCWPS